MDYQKYFDIAEEASKLAVNFLNKNYGTLKKLNHKTDTHFGIDEDVEVDKIYTDFLTKHSPEVSLYTEEGVRRISDLTWIVDPIEGTSNYRVGNPFFATQICLLENGRPVLTIVDAPILGQKFTAIKGQGSFLNGKRIEVSKTDKLDMALVSVGKGTKSVHLEWLAHLFKKMMPHIRSVRMLSSTGLELSYTAAGLFDLHINNGSQIYDFAPAILLIEEAGGIVVNKEGKKWSLDDDFIIAGNKYITTEIMKKIV